MYDITIIGGGPAGATLARLLGKKYKVLLLERRSFERTEKRVREKCCGGLIAPDAQLMLAKFGLGIPKSVLVSPQLFAVRTIDLDNSIERFYQRHYLNIDREEFDRWLQSLVPSEVNILNSSIYKSFIIEEDYVLIRYFCNGKEYTEKTRLLVGADGAASCVRKQGFPDCPKPKVYVSIQEWFKTGKSMDYYGAVFDSEITDFYSWTIPKESCMILGSALEPDNKVIERFELLKKKLARYGFEFNKSIKRNGAFILRPSNDKDICLGNNRIALVGEAAGFISPSSAEGLSYAFRSSLALAKALGQGLDGFLPIYGKHTVSLKLNILLKNIKSPIIYNKILRNFVMRTDLLSMDIENI